mmetsp:Transcript_69126/g.155245  ORF Transcript_69126/g.155245 Transcript_69126/m.155245 type:complete len:219 (+) Transcript_69126:187-843(+)
MGLAPPIQYHVSLGATGDAVPPKHRQVEHVALGEIHTHWPCVPVEGATISQRLGHRARVGERRHRGAERLHCVEAVRICGRVEVEALVPRDHDQEIFPWVGVYGGGVVAGSEVGVHALQVSAEATTVDSQWRRGTLLHVLDELRQFLVHPCFAHVASGRLAIGFGLLQVVEELRQADGGKGVADIHRAAFVVQDSIGLDPHKALTATGPQVVEVVEIQ